MNLFKGTLEFNAAMTGLSALKFMFMPLVQLIALKSSQE